MKSNVILSITCLTFIFRLLSCARINEDDKVKSHNNYFSIEKDTIDLLQGAWTTKEDDNSGFLIINDTILYFSHPEEYFSLYRISNDTFKIYVYFRNDTTIEYQTEVKYKILKLTEDSLFLLNIYQNGKITKLYKRK